MSLSDLTLVLGGAASGKSAFAEGQITGSGRQPVYIATAQAFDAEMIAKIAAHQDMRGAGWRTIEEPTDLSAALAGASSDEAVLIDCATLWLTNLILADADLDAAQEHLLAAIETCPAPVVIVSNEVGSGIVPDNALSRRFRNAQGRLNQALAARADHVVAVMAGLPLTLKAPK
ncbi:bifunctional adenosylcobinamide kinase/adenosylcobinamide-phosphate guanylyltransferase [Flavimaricola marinus]|uniref:Bifunctional adenosylcobalamin biosynthesis protein n=1 Tax=Flavimaricola marinus TaxID=1819565 RepID=A0A238L8U7_9RHOB|nr:bifunctional adenosylcobinamide kinase/adenosylcobinamide-phosphate guanylyltransferase [Flavimaricola marinus]SMY06021.1 Bifunctional adenosylcobalamin biosynthesis protein CobP [Flavimaricola marinus]